MAKAHVALQRRLADCYAGRVVSDPRESAYYRKILGLDGGPWRETANYQAMLVASWAWRVELHDLPEEERQLALSQVRKLYELEREQGMFRNECLCPDPHAGMHLEAHLAILCLGVVFSIAKLKEPALDWLGRALRLYRALASPDGEPWLPGLRVKTKLPRNQAAAALVREVFSLPHRRESGRIISAEELATPGTSRGPYYFAALRWLLRILQEDPELRTNLQELAMIGPFPRRSYSPCTSPASRPACSPLFSSRRNRLVTAGSTRSTGSSSAGTNPAGTGRSRAEGGRSPLRRCQKERVSWRVWRSRRKSEPSQAAQIVIRPARISIP